MSTVYSERFYIGLGAGAGASKVLYVVPAGKVAIIKCTTAYSSTPGVSGGIWTVNGTWVLNDQLQTQGTVVRTELGIVLHQGDELEHFNGAGAWQLSASGYLLNA